MSIAFARQPDRRPVTIGQNVPCRFAAKRSYGFIWNAMKLGLDLSFDPSTREFECQFRP
jgi:hypothetical protein